MKNQIKIFIGLLFLSNLKNERYANCSSLFGQVPHKTIQKKAAISRAYSTNNSFVPVKIYKNADLHKLQILQENKGKAGIYR
jgi:hypothetical protein